MPVSLFDEIIESKVTLETESAAMPEDAPFHLLMLGDWGGESTFSKNNLAERRPIEIDRDEFNFVLRRISPEITLKFEGIEENPLKLKFETLDDFHPDNIFRRLPLFAELKDIRRRLGRPETFNEAAAEIRAWHSPSDKNPPEAEINSVSPQAQTVAPENILDLILDNKTQNLPTKPPSPKSELSDLIGKIVAPHIIKTDAEEQSRLLLVVDEVISDIMRKILHHPAFQRLESAWRGLYFLVRNVETDSLLKISLLQLTRQELAANLSSVSNLTESAIFRQLVSETDSASVEKKWAAVFGNYEFDASVEDIAALVRLAKIAATGDFSFISTVKPNIFGVNSFAEDFRQIDENSSSHQLWATLCAVSESSYLGFAVPRFIGRLPYGKDTDPAESFYFEELIDFAAHDDYLWLNSCFASAVALARNFQRNGWQIDHNSALSIENLPLYFYQSDGETTSLPCAETSLTESKYNLILKQGLMALISARNEDRIQISALRSISAAAPKLRGRWK